MAIPIDAAGWLVPGQYGPVRVVRHPQTQKTVPLLPELDGKPLGIVWHWAAGGYGSGLSNDVTNYMVTAPYDEARKASWHLFISKRGEIHQFAPISVGTWTTGASGRLYDPSTLLNYRDVGNVNRATVGVELENAGVLLKAPDGNWYAWPYGIGAEGLTEPQAQAKAAQGGISFQSAYRVDASRARAWSDGNTYDGWPTVQQQAAQEAARSIAAWAGWTDPRHLHYGHRTFDSKRDPGLLWMDGVLPAIERALFPGGSTGGPSVLPFLLAVGAGFGAVWLFRRK